MSKISVVIIFLLQAGTSFAQKYFVFIGAENRQPFYVRVDSEFHSSSEEGHLILSELKDSSYNITIGFPGQTLPEQHYAFNIHGKDQAFELRSQDASGLRLYDLQQGSWFSSQGGGGAGDDLHSAGVKKDDAFSRMMAGVVHDTAVLYNTYAMEQALSDSPSVVTTQPAEPAPAAKTAMIPADTGTARSVTDNVAKPTPDSAARPIIDSSAANAATTSPAITVVPAVTMTPETSTAVPTTPATIPAASAIKPATSVASIDSLKSTDTTSRSGVIVHQPARQFNDSGTAPLFRPIPRDSAAAPAPIPSTVGAPLFRAGPAVTKLSERHSPKNVRLVYADHVGGKKTDTIVVIIPVDSPAVDKTGGRQPHVSDSSHIPPNRAHGPNADSPVVSSGTAYRPAIPPSSRSEAPRPHPADTTRRPADTAKHSTKAIPFVNSDCHDFATDFDVDKLRVRMLESGKDDDRITLARKTFKSKCFSTRQIRSLNEVFTSDAAKFRFLEAAWPYAADEHFHELSDLLADPVYINKFKVMTHQQ